MRVLVLVAAALVASLTGGCAEKRGPYCAWTSQYTNCGYFSIESCRASLKGTDHGICGDNPAYKGPR